MTLPKPIAIMPIIPIIPPDPLIMAVAPSPGSERTAGAWSKGIGEHPMAPSVWPPPGARRRGAGGRWCLQSTGMARERSTGPLGSGAGLPNAALALADRRSVQPVSNPTLTLPTATAPSAPVPSP